MKELALFIPALKYLDLLDTYTEQNQDTKNHYALWLKNNFDKIKPYIAEIPLARVYFGNEFCERLIPPVHHVEEVLQACTARKLKFSLVTPYLTDLGMEAVAKILQALSNHAAFDEVIVNDWGLLYYIRTNYPALKVVVGRLLDKMKRDPRFGRRDYERLFNGEGLKMLKSPSVSAVCYQDFLKHFGVERAELDNVQQGLHLEAPEGIKISVYLPFGFVTNGRICQFAGIHNPRDEKFRVTSPCRRECQSYEQFMQKAVSPIPDHLEDDEVGKISLIRKGNTVFYLNNVVDDCFTSDVFDRIVYLPVLPM